MLKYSEYRRIMEMKAAGVLQWQIVKKTGFTLYSVRKVWDMNEDEFIGGSKYTHEQLDEFKEDIIAMLTAYPTIRNNTILDRLKEKYPDREFVPSSFYRYMVRLREVEGFVKNGTRLFAARDESPPGYEAQADLGQMKLKDMYGNEAKVYFFCMVLSYSRMKFAFFSAEPFDTNRFIYAHEKAFKYFGGRQEIIMYDQDRLLLVNENAGNPIYTKIFDAYRERVGFKVFLCRKNDPDTKGKIENVVGYIKSNFLDHREYCGIDSLNSACLAWLDRTGNGTVSAATRKIPREMFELERLKLAEYKSQNIELSVQKIVSVTNVNTVIYRKNSYSLPLGMCVQGDMLRLEDDGTHFNIIDPVRNTVVVRHKIVGGKGRIVKTESPPKPQNPIVAKVKALYNDDPEAVKFIDEICEDKPRYIIQQCRLLKKIHKQCGLKESLSAIGECVAKGLFDATEVLTVLVQRHGFETAEEVLPARTKAHYNRKAKGLNKYDALVGED